jgi:hypothetical protein
MSPTGCGEVLNDERVIQVRNGQGRNVQGRNILNTLLNSPLPYTGCEVYCFYIYKSGIQGWNDQGRNATPQ